MKIVVRDAVSLKDKRRVARSLKDRLRDRFQVAVAEIAAQDSRQQLVLGVALPGTDATHLSRVLNKVVDFVRGHPVAQLCDFDIEMR